MKRVVLMVASAALLRCGPAELEGEALAEQSAALPAGVPTYTHDDASCFLDGEKERAERRIETIELKGCAEPIVKPFKSILACGSYAPGNYEVHHCEWARRDYFATVAGNKASKDFAKLADRSQDREPESDQITCLARTLKAWAKADGLSVNHPDSNGQAHHERAWKMATFASFYNRMPNLRTRLKQLDANDEVKRWFERQGDRVQSHVNKVSCSNNLCYWKGYSLLAMGVASETPRHVTKAHEIFLDALGDIEMDRDTSVERGFLPAELDRGQRAQHYHAYALQPLLGMYALSRAAGCSFMTRVEGGGKEDRLAALIGKAVHGYRRPQFFYDKTRSLQATLTDIEPFLPLLGGGAQSERILRSVKSYLRNQANYELDLRRVEPGERRNLGGRLEYFPAPGSLPFANARLREFCE